MDENEPYDGLGQSAYPMLAVEQGKAGAKPEIGSDQRGQNQGEHGPAPDRGPFQEAPQRPSVPDADAELPEVAALGQVLVIGFLALAAIALLGVPRSRREA